MDVALGATNVPLPRRFIRLFYSWVFFFLVLCQAVWALEENQPIHFSGDRQIWDRKANRVELFGHAAVNQTGETLTADYIKLDMNARILDAKGNCVHVASDSAIWGDEMHFNLDTRTGTVVDGRVSNDKFTLRGNRINKLGPGRFQVHWGDYTTCHDCAGSWSLLAEDVEMEIGKYAYLSNVVTNIKGAPAFWMPYMVVPIKTQRQTGFLFPKFASSPLNGFTFGLPFFWAINRSSDATVTLGAYTAKGIRVETEGRYVLADGVSGAKANFYFTGDRNFPVSRWAVDLSQRQNLFWGIDEKLRVSEVGDNLYPFYFSSDLPAGAGEAFLPSTLMFSRGSSDVSAFVSLQRYRNLLNSVPNDSSAQLLQFDSRTVQAYPNAMISVNDKPLFGSPVVGGLNLGFTNFTRTAGNFDYDDTSVGYGQTLPIPAPAYNPGVDPIRKAMRLSYNPSLYTSFRPFDIMSVVPSLQYKGYVYDFGGFAPRLSRGYLLFQTDLSAQIERIYDYPDDKEIPRTKHLIRPLLTYSYIPFIQEDSGHPFVQQIKQTNRASAPAGYNSNFVPGYNFDNYDIVPYTYQASSANYFVPLGNSLTYGFTTQWIRKKSDLAYQGPGYQNAVEFTAGQGLNFLEVAQPQDPSSPKVLTRFLGNLNLNLDRFTSSTTYNYYPDEPNPTARQTLSTGLTYIMTRAIHQQALQFDRSITLSYAYSQRNAKTSNIQGTLNFSISDYLLPQLNLNYDLMNSAFLGGNLVMLLQSPSRCWRISTTINYGPTTGISYSFDWGLNLSGSGFGGVTDFANQLAVQQGSAN